MNSQPSHLYTLTSASEHDQIISVQQTSEPIPLNITENSSGTMEIITIDSKASLQMELLRHQIEFTKRDLLLLELKILEKERSLLLTAEEKSHLSKNSKSAFNDRKEIDFDP